MRYAKFTQIFVFIFICSFSNFSKGAVLSDFSDTSVLTLNGDAKTVATSDGIVLRLTSAQTFNAGSAFSKITVNVSDFSTYFKFRITEPGGNIFDCNTESGADGIVFVVQSISSDIGGSGGGIGYEGIDNSVGIEFDTWCNSAHNDPDSNHLGILAGGSVVHSGSLENKTLAVTPRFDDENLWYAWIDYNGATLEVRINQTGIRPESADLSANIDINSELGGVNNAYFGFTSGTGSDFGNHDIISWEFIDQYSPILGDVDQTNCEAATLTPDLKLSIPRIEWDQGLSQNKVPISAELRYVPSNDGKILFEVTNYQVLPE